MFSKQYLILLIFLILINGCSKKEDLQVSQLTKVNINEQMIEAYKEGLKALDNQNGIIAAKKFSEAEILFPQSIWAPRSALMTAYSFYTYGYYIDCINEIERYLKTYPLHNRKDYAYYLLGLSYYEQIVDEKKDIEPIINAKKNFIILKEKYSNTEFALDATYKLELINEMLASKEMYIGRYYMEREKWIPAINRFKTIVQDYNTTIFIEEALHRLVEIHYKIGLIEESKNYAQVLGYNYNSSEWYEKSYKVFNKNYAKIRKKKKKEKTLINKLKSIIN